MELGECLPGFMESFRVAGEELQGVAGVGEISLSSWGREHHYKPMLSAQDIVPAPGSGAGQNAVTVSTQRAAQGSEAGASTVPVSAQGAGRPAKTNKHQCLECGRCFTQASSLLRHRRVHTGERPFPCQVCGKGFIQASDLVKHGRVHSGERAFWCPQCGKKFRQPETLAKHRKLLHRGEDMAAYPQEGAGENLRLRVDQPQVVLGTSPISHFQYITEGGNYLTPKVSHGVNHGPCSQRDKLGTRKQVSDPSHCAKQKVSPVREEQATSQIASGLRDWVKQEECPVVGEEMPGPSDVVPGPSDTVTGSRGHVPHLKDEVPNEEVPHLHEEVPHLNEEVPHLNEEVPHLNEEAPHLNEEAPHLNEEAPHLNEEAPHLNEEILHPNVWDNPVKVEPESNEKIPDPNEKITDHSDWRNPLMDEPETGQFCGMESAGSFISESRDLGISGMLDLGCVSEASCVKGREKLPLSSLGEPVLSERRRFLCLECGRHFTQASSLLRHRRVHTGERPFPCQVCGKGFIQASDLVKHNRVHSGERAFCCPQCGKRFRQPETLAKHRKLLHRGEGVRNEEVRHPDERILQANEKVTDPNDLGNPLRDAQFFGMESTSSFVAENRKLEPLGILDLGQGSVLGAGHEGVQEKMEESIQRQKEGVNVRDVVEEDKQQWPEPGRGQDAAEDTQAMGLETGEAGLTTALTETTFTQVQERDEAWPNGVRTQTEAESQAVPRARSRAPVFWCQRCGADFNSLLGLVRHQRRHKHEPGVCRKRIPPPSPWGQVSHSIQGTTPLQSSKAQASQANDRQRRATKKEHRCLECGRRFTQASSLSRHRHVHTGERPFQCQVCGKGFIQASDLVKHGRVHSGEKSFWCPQNGKKFRQAEALAKHRKLLHRGEAVAASPQQGAAGDLSLPLSLLPGLDLPQDLPQDLLGTAPGSQTQYIMEGGNNMSQKNSHWGNPGLSSLEDRLRAREQGPDPNHWDKQQVSPVREEPGTSEDASSLRDWVKQEECSVVGEELPGPSEGITGLQGQDLQLNEEVPHIIEEVQHLIEEVPHFNEEAPCLNQETPDLSDWGNPVKIEPKTNEKIPDSSDWGNPPKDEPVTAQFFGMESTDSFIAESRGLEPLGMIDLEHGCVPGAGCLRVRENVAVISLRKFVPSKPRRFLCLECGRRFTQVSSLLRHRRVHTGERPFLCQVCGKGFIQASDLVKHNRVHSGERAFWCPQSGKRFRQTEPLAKHSKLLHRGAEEDIQDLNEKVAHEKIQGPSHWGNSLMDEPMPGQFFEMKSTDSFHASSQSLEPTGMLNLGQDCVAGAGRVRGGQKVEEGKHLHRETGRGQHRAEHTQAVGLELEEAGLTNAETKTTFNQVQEHSETLPQSRWAETETESQTMPTARSRAPVFWCSCCGADFNSLLGLVRHQRQHIHESGIRRKNFPPPTHQGEIAQSLAPLRQQTRPSSSLRREQAPAQPHPPPSLQGQRSHGIQDTTQPQSPMTLAFWSSDSASWPNIPGSSKLRQRRPTKREHRCLECGRRFTQASSLLRHRRVHTGERPFRCHVCGKGFIQASDLVKHSRVHSGERTFCCPQCGKMFRQPEALAKHCKLLHEGAGGPLSVPIDIPQDLLGTGSNSQTQYITEGGNYLTPKASHWDKPGPSSLRDRLRGREEGTNPSNWTKQQVSPVMEDPSTSQDVSDLGDWVKQEVCSVVSEEVPGPIESVKGLCEQVPHVNETISHVNEEVPHLNEEDPHLNEEVPHVNEEVPHLNEEVLHLNKEVPHLTKEVPQLIEEIPHLTAEVPDLSDSGNPVKIESETTRDWGNPQRDEPEKEQSLGMQSTGSFITESQGLELPRMLDSGYVPGAGRASGQQKVALRSPRERVPSERRRFLCLECGRRFTQASSLLRHRRVHTGERPFLCQVCGKGFIQASDLVKHSRVHSGERAFWCPQCGKRFRQPETLAKHRKLLHGVEVQRNEQVTDFEERIQGPNDWRISLSNEPVTGQFFGIESTGSFSAESRDLQPPGMLDLGQGCMPGAARVRGREKVEVGKSWHRQAAGDQYVAEDTQAVGSEPGEAGLADGFTRVQERRETETESHAEPRARTRSPLFQCPRCGMEFNSVLGLVRHQRRHRHETAVCQKHLPPPSPQEKLSHGAQDTTSPQNSISLTSRPSDPHRRAIKREHRCLECGRRFTQASSLLRHRRVHTGERPFRCHVCSKGFIQASDLVKHNRVHSGERTFCCPQCDKIFRQPETLAKHCKLLHQGAGGILSVPIDIPQDLLGTESSSHTQYITEGGNYMTPNAGHWDEPGPSSLRDRLGDREVGTNHGNWAKQEVSPVMEDPSTSQDVSDLGDWVKEEVCPVVGEEIPGPSESAKGSCVQVPRVNEEISHLKEEDSQMNEELPHMDEGVRDLNEVPHLNEEVPHLNEEVPHLNEEVPHLNEEVPHLNEEVPHLIEEVPHLIEEVQHLIEEVPHLNEKVPHLNEEVPHLNEEVPHLNEDVPHLNEEVPILNKEVPNLNEEIPHLNVEVPDVSRSGNQDKTETIEKIPDPSDCGNPLRNKSLKGQFWGMESIGSFIAESRGLELPGMLDSGCVPGAGRASGQEKVALRSPRERVPSERRRFLCLECGRRFTQASSLLRHRRVHTGERPFLCQVCGKGFIQTSDLVKHRRVHSGERAFWCPQCGKRFRQPETLAKHRKLLHGVEVQRNEQVSDFEERIQGPNDRRISLSNEPVTGQFFGNESTGSFSAESQDLQPPGMLDLGQGCMPGAARVRGREKVEVGKSWHRQAAVDQYVAGDTQAVGLEPGEAGLADGFTRVQERRETETESHAEPRARTRSPLFQCPRCGMEFNSVLGLVRHQRRHRHETAVCQKHLPPPSPQEKLSHGAQDTTSPQNSISLTSRPSDPHCRTIKREHRCLECGRRFTQASSLLRHRRVHTGERPFPCKVCGKGFIQASDLVKHGRVHSGERAFWCHQCGKRFRQPETLAKHHKLLHQGEGLAHSLQQGQEGNLLHSFSLPLLLPPGLDFPQDRLGTALGSKDMWRNREFGLNGSQKEVWMCEGQRLFRCLVCGKYLSSPSALSRHHRIHCRDQALKCPERILSYHHQLCHPLGPSSQKPWGQGQLQPQYSPRGPQPSHWGNQEVSSVRKKSGTSQEISRLQDWVKQEVSPVVGQALPGKGLTGLRGQVPHLNEKITYPTGQVPHFNGQDPHLCEGIPHLNEKITDPREWQNALRAETLTGQFFGMESTTSFNAESRSLEQLGMLDLGQDCVTGAGCVRGQEKLEDGKQRQKEGENVREKVEESKQHQREMDGDQDRVIDTQALGSEPGEVGVTAAMTQTAFTQLQDHGEVLPQGHRAEIDAESQALPKAKSRVPVFWCPRCRADFNSLLGLVKHQRRHRHEPGMCRKRFPPPLARGQFSHGVQDTPPKTSTPLASWPCQRQRRMIKREHRCLECGRRFTQASSLLRHRRVHTGERPFRCQVCGKGFIQASDLVKHGRVHSGERAFWCPQCGKRFRQPETLAKHCKLLHQVEALTTSPHQGANGNLSLPFDLPLNLPKDVLGKVPSPPTQYITEGGNYLTPKASHWGDPRPCSQRDRLGAREQNEGPDHSHCDKQEDPHIMEEPVTSHNVSGLQDWMKQEEYPVMGEELPSPSDKVKGSSGHITNLNEEVPQRSEEVPHLSEEIPDLSDWGNPVKNEPETNEKTPDPNNWGNPLRDEPVTGQFFGMESAGSFIAESRGLGPLGMLDLTCVPGAGRVSSREKVALRSRREHVSSEQRRFLCLECGRHFTQASSLLRHRRVHTGERPFLCQVCGKGFIQASDLVKHRRVHSGERAFWCPQCGKRFRQPETLAKHRKLMHRGEGEAATASSETLAAGPAQRRYPEVVVECSDSPVPRRFPCLLCGRELSSSSSLLRHRRVCPSGQRLHLGV